MIVVKRPIITEKSITLYQDEQKATFEVALRANKLQARKVIEDLYNVKVEKVWTHTRLGKTKVNRINRKKGRTASKKFMIFKLEDGNKIDIFEQ